MKGRVVLVTGATSGIGKAAAIELARRGAALVIVSRSHVKLDRLIREIKAQTKNSKIDAIQADLSSLSEVRNAAQAFLQRWERLDVLLNNVGAMFVNRRESVDGYEMTFALNHLSYFLLTNLLLSRLRNTSRQHGEARIVNVASGLHAKVKLDFDDLQHRKSYSWLPVYSRSKLMNVLFTYELARRLRGSNVTANVLEPGVVRTGFGRNNGWLASYIVMPILQLFAKAPEQGAETSVFLAASTEIKGITGRYWADKQSQDSSAASRDPTTQKRLWDVSEELVARFQHAS